MSRDTLLDFFEDFSTVDEPFIVHDDGYRIREATYRDIARAARAFAARLAASGIGPGDKVVIWSENRPEWVVALWGTLLAGAVLVPVDFRASQDLLARIAAIVQAKAVLVGAEQPDASIVTAPLWPLAVTADLAAEAPAPRPAVPVSGQTLAEIIFTSGATAEPKGVTITHRNVLSNIVPIEREVKKYLRYERPFHPVRFLNLLPMSHMFGQSMATFVPPMIKGTVVFANGYSPTEIVHQIHARRVSVLVCVPKVLQVLREHVERMVPETAAPDALAGKHFLWRWWHYRRAHRLLGWKFWCVICGAAPLEADLENFWRKIGFLVVQGYGLTETAPIVTLNHPFKASRGTVGTAIGGVTIKIADDGEILVRGDNVTTGYYNPTGDTPTAALDDGWFHTGDIGELDGSGRLHIKGRKKEMIATAQGMKVFPEDVERVLLAQPGVKEAAVVGVPSGGEERVHAVLVLEAGQTPEAAVREANAVLEDHQRIWSAAVWPGATLPRTEGTEKLKRVEIRRWARGEAASSAPDAGHGAERSVTAVVRRFVPSQPIGPETTLDQLGLSSLDRVELMMALEDAFHVTLDESEVSGDKTLQALEQVVRQTEPGGLAPRPGTPSTGAADEARTRAEGPIAFPAWNRWRAIWLLRRLSLPTWILPLGRIFMTLEVSGLEHLDAVRGPVVFAANHQSHMDAPAIMLAMPARRRYALAIAMAKEFFTAHFNRVQFGWRAWFTNSLNYYLSCCFFNTFPLPQREAGTRQTLRYIGEIARDGYSILIFPEGKRTQSGEIARFRPGVGMIAARLDLPVIPVRLEGLEKVLHQRMRWPRRGPVRVAFGAPIELAGENYEALAREVEEAVRRL